MTLIDDITYTLTGDVHNFRIIRSALSERVLLDPNGADRTISGLLVTDPTATRLLIVHNISETHSIEFLEQDAGSDEQNRFLLGATVGPLQSAILFYEPADHRWRVPNASTVEGGTDDHGELTGLADDDHLQYAYLGGRAGGQILNGGVAAGEDLRLLSTAHATKGDIFIGLFTWPTADGLSGQVMTTDGSGVLSFTTPAEGVTDHGLLTGLADDDHTQYARLGGRAGSQTLNGGTAASEDLRLVSTAHATKGDIFIGLLTWPTADGSANQVMITNGSGQLAFATVTSLFDHGQLSGLGDDDHTQYVLAEPSSTDNRLVRWDGGGGRSIQTSGVTLSDTDAMTGLFSAAASNFYSVGNTPATAGQFRGQATFSLQVRNAGNTANVPIVSWASDDVTFGDATADTNIVGLTIDLNTLRWPLADGTTDQVMVTNGSGQLSFTTVTSLFDHGTLSGLGDDDHTQYVLAEPSSTDNRLVRWDGTTGRAIQSSGATLSDGDALTGLASAAASSFVSVGGTVATAGAIRGDSAFVLRARDAGNTANAALLSWASDDLALGSTSYDTDILGATIDIGVLRWPSADGAANAVMITNGSGVLSLVAVTSLFDHGQLGGLSDDDHTLYMLAEPSSTDNRLVRWDGTGGRSVQSSGVTLNDSEAMSGLASVAMSGFASIGGTPATAGHLRGNSTFSLQSRNTSNLADVSLLAWALDVVILGSISYDTHIRGSLVRIRDHIWPNTDGTSGQFMRTNGAGDLSFATPDHGDLGGLGDDDHSLYMLAEPSSTDNRLVRWDGATGRAVQTSTATLTDAGNLQLNGGNLTTGGGSIDTGGGSIDTAGGTLGMGGGAIIDAGSVEIESTSPTLTLIDTTASDNGGWWRQRIGSEDFILSTLDDAGAVLDDVVRFRRTGATYDYTDFVTSYVRTNRADESGVTTSNLSSGTNDNFSLSSTVTQLRLTSSGFGAVLAGLQGGTQGRKVYLTNVDSDEDMIFIKNEATTSTAANRLLTSDGQDVGLAPGATAILFYDGVSSRWRVVSSDGSKWRMRGVIQTTGSSAVEFFSVAMPTNFVFFVNVWVVSRREAVGPEDESAHAISHFEIAYKRYATGNAIPGSDDGAGQDTNDDSRPRTVTKIIEHNHGHVRLVGTNSGTAVSLQVDPASAVTWRHNWVVEILAVPMDPYV